MTMSANTITVKAAAVRLRVSTTIIYTWRNHGCPWLGGNRLAITDKKRQFGAKLCNVASVERVEGTIDYRDVERIERARTAAGVTPDGLISRPDALRKFSWLTTHMLRQWTLPLTTHHRYKRRGKRTKRGNCLALGKPLHVERRDTFLRGCKRVSPFYKIAELEAIDAVLAADLQRVVHVGIDYATTVRLRTEHRWPSLEVGRLAAWLPDYDFIPLKRVMPTKLRSRALAKRLQLLWPVALTQLAIDRREAARRTRFFGRGRRIQSWVQEHLAELPKLETNGHAAIKINGEASKKRSRGRPCGQRTAQAADDARLLNDYESAGCGMEEFARNRFNGDQKALKRALSRARMQRSRRRKAVTK
jgi:hypothetical protein